MASLPARSVATSTCANRESPGAVGRTHLGPTSTSVVTSLQSTICRRSGCGGVGEIVTGRVASQPMATGAVALQGKLTRIRPIVGQALRLPPFGFDTTTTTGDSRVRETPLSSAAIALQGKLTRIRPIVGRALRLPPFGSKPERCDCGLSLVGASRGLARAGGANGRAGGSSLPHTVWCAGLGGTRSVASVAGSGHDEAWPSIQLHRSG